MNPARNERGMVLLLVLAIVALLSGLLTEFAFSTLVDMRLTETFRDSTRAYYLSKGGIEAGRILLQMDKNNFDHPGELWAQGVPSFPVGEEGVISITIEDLQGKLDLNSLVDQQGNYNGPLASVLVRLFADLGLDTPDDLVAALIDWMDRNTDITQAGSSQYFNGEGAEGGYYRQLENPYDSKDGRLDTLDEVLMVRGFTREVLDIIDDYVTIRESASGVPHKLNINTVKPEILFAMQALDPNVDPSELERIIEHRKDTPFEKLSDLGNLLGVQSDTYSILSTQTAAPFEAQSNFYRILADAGVNEGVRSMEAFTDDKGKSIYSVKVN